MVFKSVGKADNRFQQFGTDAWLEVCVLTEAYVTHHRDVGHALPLDVDVLIQHPCRLEQ